MTIAKKAAAAAFFVFVAAAHAQGDVPVQRPQVHAGDSWTYRYTLYAPTNRTTIVDSQVTYADDRVIHLVANDVAGVKDTDLTYTSDWNLVASRRTGIYEPNSGMLKFPLRPGDSWPSRYRITFPREDYFTEQDRIARVEGWEDVQVPAGKFHALKVVAQGSSKRSDRPLLGSVREVMWYAPEVKRYVKWTYEAGGPRTVNRSFEYELVDYRVQ
jgi:hypothetical protein